MGHITDIAEDSAPAPSASWISIVGNPVGVPDSRPDMLHRPPFYEPRLATIAPGNNGPIKAMCPAGISSPSDIGAAAVRNRHRGNGGAFGPSSFKPIAAFKGHMGELRCGVLSPTANIR